MGRYGAVPAGNPILADIKAKREGLYEFKLYPQLWSCPKLAAYYKGRKWQVVPFTSPPPVLPASSGIYMFVVGPYCGDLKDHSYIVYVGKATNLRKRYSEYLQEKAGKCANPRERVVLVLNEFEDYLYFHYTSVPKNELTEAEALLKDNLTPFCNTQLELKGRLTA